MSEREPSSLVTDPANDGAVFEQGSADRRSSASPTGVETAPGRRRRGARSTREPQGAARGSWFPRIAATLLSLQLLALLAASAYQFAHYDVGSDFATYAQAWWLIGHGHLDPYSTTLASPFLANQAQLLLWPLALLEPLFPSGLTLLWLEDAAIVATNVLTLVWAERVVDERRTAPSRRRTVLRSLALISIVLSPWVYETALFSFHVEPFVGLFAVAAGLAAWTGQTRWLWIAVPLLLATGVVGLLAAAGLGLALLVGPRTERTAGAVVLLCAAAWLVGLSTIGLVGGGATIFSRSLGYLDLPSGQRVGAVALGLHVLTHLGATLSVLVAHLPILAVFLIPVGLVGVATRWGGAMVLTLMLPPALLTGMMSLTLVVAVQVWPALPFVLVGSVMILLGAPNQQVEERRGPAQDPSPRPSAASRIGLPLRAAFLAWLTFLLVLDLVIVRDVLGSSFLYIPSGTAEQLQRVQARIPVDAEVIGTPGEIGRFAMRPAVTSTLYSGESVHVTRGVVVFVLVLGSGTSADATFGAKVEEKLHARLLSLTDGVATLVWHPGRLGGELGFPSATYRTAAATSRQPGGRASGRG